MRGLIETEKPPRDGWDLKLVPGGLIDLEFIAQCAVLAGEVDGAPTTSTAEILARLKPGFADRRTVDELTRAYALYAGLTQMIRLCIDGPFDRADLPPGLADLLTAVADLPDFGVLDAHVRQTARTVRAHFARLLGRPRKSD